MKKIYLSLIAAFCTFSFGFAQEVKTETEISGDIETIVMTIDADRPIDLKGFDWEGILRDVFTDVPDDAVIGIRVNISDRQLTSDNATLSNKTSFYVQDYAKNKRSVLTQVVRSVNNFIDDNQQGYNITEEQKSN